MLSQIPVQLRLAHPGAARSAPAVWFGEARRREGSSSRARPRTGDPLAGGPGSNPEPALARRRFSRSSPGSQVSRGGSPPTGRSPEGLVRRAVGSAPPGKVIGVEMGRHNAPGPNGSDQPLFSHGGGFDRIQDGPPPDAKRRRQQRPIDALRRSLPAGLRADAPQPDSVQPGNRGACPDHPDPRTIPDPRADHSPDRRGHSSGNISSPARLSLPVLRFPPALPRARGNLVD